MPKRYYAVKGQSVTALAGLVAAAAHGLLAQSAGAPRFAVATVKRNPSTEVLTMAVPMGVGYRPGGRLVAGNVPVAMLIQRAYSVQGFQVVGGPSWINTDGYDIEAKPEGSTDQKQMWLMLQTLLADRFKLAMHRETRDLPVWDLQTVKGGAKLPVPQRTQLLGGDDNASRARTAAPGPAVRPWRGRVRHRVGYGGSRRVHAGVRKTALADPGQGSNR